MKMVLEAYRFAEKKHSGQFRKKSGIPYVAHPIAVSYIVSSCKKSKHLEEILTASILHDTLEDTDTNFTELAQEFSPLVASLVLELSNDEQAIKELGKLEYQKKKLVGISSYALVIKLADRLHNISDNPTDKMVLDTMQLLDYLCLNRKLSGTQEKLVADIRQLCSEKIEFSEKTETNVNKPKM